MCTGSLHPPNRAEIKSVRPRSSFLMRKCDFALRCKPDSVCRVLGCNDRLLAPQSPSRAAALMSEADVTAAEEPDSAAPRDSEVNGSSGSAPRRPVREEGLWSAALLISRRGSGAPQASASFQLAAGRFGAALGEAGGCSIVGSVLAAVSQHLEWCRLESCSPSTPCADGAAPCGDSQMCMASAKFGASPCS